jgi:hypothetical protein
MLPLCLKELAFLVIPYIVVHRNYGTLYPLIILKLFKLLVIKLIYCKPSYLYFDSCFSMCFSYVFSLIIVSQICALEAFAFLP